MTSAENTETITCAECAAPVHPLEVFPKGVCLECHAASPEGRRMVTADELVSMWGGPARKRRA